MVVILSIDRGYSNEEIRIMNQRAFRELLLLLLRGCSNIIKVLH